MVALWLVMTLATIHLYPENTGKFGLPTFIWTITLLLAYLFVCLRLTAIGSAENSKMALLDGTKTGAIAGIIGMVHVTIEYFLFIPKGINGFITLAFMAILFIAFGVSAYITMNKTNHIVSALLSGIWCAMLSILVLFIYGFLLNFIFLHHLIIIMAYDEEFKMSHMSIRAYTFHNTLESGGTHLLIAPVVALVFSFIAIILLKAYRFVFRP